MAAMGLRLLAWAALVGAQWTYPVPQAPTSPPELSNATTTGMTVTWEPTIESESYAVDAYRVEVLSLQERHKGWQVLDDAVEEARTRNEVQFINVRVDRGRRVSGGGFWLYLAYDGIHPIDTDHKQAVTPEIPWDASAAQMKSALEALDTVNVVQVRRCDASFLPNRDLTGTGAEAWVGRCPFGHLGGYTWVVEFERPRAEMDEGVVIKEIPSLHAPDSCIHGYHCRFGLNCRYHHTDDQRAIFECRLQRRQQSSQPSAAACAATSRSSGASCSGCAGAPVSISSAARDAQARASS